MVLITDAVRIDAKKFELEHVAVDEHLTGRNQLETVVEMATTDGVDVDEDVVVGRGTSDLRPPLGIDYLWHPFRNAFELGVGGAVRAVAVDLDEVAGDGRCGRSERGCR